MSQNVWFLQKCLIDTWHLDIYNVNMGRIWDFGNIWKNYLGFVIDDLIRQINSSGYVWSKTNVMLDIHLWNMFNS